MQGGVVGAPLEAAVDVPGRFGPLLQLKTNDGGTVMAPERLGTTSQDAFIMPQGLRRTALGERRSFVALLGVRVGVSRIRCRRRALQFHDQLRIVVGFQLRGHAEQVIVKPGRLGRPPHRELGSGHRHGRERTRART